MTIDDMQARATLKGGDCLSQEYINSYTPLVWRCEKGHTWEAAFYQIKRGNWCGACAISKRKCTIEEMREIALSKGGVCLSDEYVNSSTKLQWQCKEGHIWMAQPGNVKQGYWCPYCAGTVKLTIEEMHEIAFSHSGKCLSKNYINSNTHLFWKCKKGHTWSASPGSIKGGSWCPVCAGLAKLTIEEMHELAWNRDGKCLSEEYVNSHTHLKWECKKGHTWMAKPLHIKNGKWCPTCAVDKKRGGIEQMHEIALSQAGKCLSEEYINRQTKLTWQCKEGHIWNSSPEYVMGGNWCSICSGKKGTIEEMQSIAESRGGKCLSKKYVNSLTHLTWQCEKGHTWNAQPGNVKIGTWCVICANMAKHKARLTIEEMNQLAMSRNGKCLSPKYINQDTKLTWQCEKGHTWSATPSLVKRGSWCKVCAIRTKHTIEDMQRIAEIHGGKCLSKTYVNAISKLIWECKEGHTWSTSQHSIKKGAWCLICANNKKRGNLKEMQDIALSRGGECLSGEYINSYSKLEWRCKENHVWQAKPQGIKMGSWCPYCSGHRKTNSS